jgi:hypothetical protein
VQYTPPLIYAVPVPYAIDIGAAEDDPDSANNNEDSDANYQGGPTIFDRRGNGAESYIPPEVDGGRDVNRVARGTPNSAYARAAVGPSMSGPTQSGPAQSGPPEPAPEPTTLVFKDGHTLEVGNYAIVGATLFDLTPGHSRKVALADLDLPSTQRENDTRGITFQLPQPN